MSNLKSMLCVFLLLLSLCLFIQNAAPLVLFITFLLVLGNVPMAAFILTCLFMAFSLRFQPVSLPSGWFFVIAVLVFMVASFWGHAFLKELDNAKRRLEIFLYRRKLYRMMGLVFPLVIFPTLGRSAYQCSLITLGSILVGVELLRWRSPSFNERFCNFFSKVSKEEERLSVTGTTMYLTSAALTSFFPGVIGPLSLIIVTIGDAWAVLIGANWGKKVIRRGKTVEGTAACVFSCLMSALAFGSLEVFHGVSISAIVLGAIGASAAELLTEGKYDNFTMAVAAALSMYGVWVL